jgi:hypothetical protein
MHNPHTKTKRYIDTSKHCFAVFVDEIKQRFESICC